MTKINHLLMEEIKRVLDDEIQLGPPLFWQKRDKMFKHKYIKKGIETLENMMYKLFLDHLII